MYLTLWAELKRRVHKRGPRTLDGLERFCKKEWSQIPFSVILQPYYVLQEKTLCCFIGRGGLYKVLNAGGAIIVAHTVLLNMIIS